MRISEPCNSFAQFKTDGESLQVCANEADEEAFREKASHQQL
jgi:hypothetical protein